MRRSAFCAGYRMNPVTTEKFETGFRSGDTLPDANYETPNMDLELGNVQNGLSHKAPLYQDQPEYTTEKIYKKARGSEKAKQR